MMRTKKERVTQRDGVKERKTVIGKWSLVGVKLGVGRKEW